MLRFFRCHFRAPKASSYSLQVSRQHFVVNILPGIRRAYSQPASEPSNKHLSVDAAGNTQVDLEFIEEPLGLSAEQGYGFPRIGFGDTLGPDRRYRVVRKLGWGMNSSIWLARDEHENKYVAIKALKGYATDLIQRGVTWELSALERVSSGPPASDSASTHCLSLLAYFVHPGKHQDGDHLCLVTDVLGGDVKSLQLSISNGPMVFPLPLAKRILLHTLRGIAHMHRRGVVHTDLKHDNILFDTGGLTTDDLNALVAADPSRLHPPEASWEGTVQAAVSQPLPLPSLSEAMTRTYLVADFGSAQPSAVPNVDEITAAGLRAPETILQGPWNEKVDIWTFGCLIFELVVARELFKHEAYEEHGLDAAAGHLWQMLCFTGERFMPDQLQASRLAPEYFDETCRLKSHPPNYRNPFAMSLRNYKVLEEKDVLSTAALMQRCLRLDPKNRATAEELLQDRWWEGIA